MTQNFYKGRHNTQILCKTAKRLCSITYHRTSLQDNINTTSLQDNKMSMQDNMTQNFYTGQRNTNSMQDSKMSMQDNISQNFFTGQYKHNFCTGQQNFYAGQYNKELVYTKKNFYAGQHNTKFCTGQQ